jgi:hypothetical protein
LAGSPHSGPFFTVEALTIHQQNPTNTKLRRVFFLVSQSKIRLRITFKKKKTTFGPHAMAQAAASDLLFSQEMGGPNAHAINPRKTH